MGAADDVDPGPAANSLASGEASAETPPVPATMAKPSMPAATALIVQNEREPTCPVLAGDRGKSMCRLRFGWVWVVVGLSQDETERTSITETNPRQHRLLAKAVAIVKLKFPELLYQR